jgi:tetratricopeptide (TPR) repeat protein
MSRRTILLAILLSLCFAATSVACLWDYDTLQMERLRFPGVLEIITGKFVRHSKPYYEWRIVDRKKKLESRPHEPSLIDDLAVAFAKLGRPEEGIALLEGVVRDHPNRYETVSNLGTLLFFAGRLDESKQTIRRALEINPDAHFGRERYQLLLTEYLQESQQNSQGVMSSEVRGQHAAPLGFAEYVLAAKLGDVERTHGHRDWTREEVDELKKATRGVLGMLHFADYTSPILLEALGDLLMTGQMESNGTQLAARAYLKASQSAKDAAAAAKFRAMAQQVLGDHIDYHIDSSNVRDDHIVAKLESQLAREVAAADQWFAEIAANEQEWIAEKRDVDQEFAAKYYDSLEQTIAAAEQQVRSEPRETRLSQRQSINRFVASAAVTSAAVSIAAIAVIIFAIRWYRRTGRRVRQSQQSQLPSL